jgi:deoxyribodipyrimidine photo-lyase
MKTTLVWLGRDLRLGDNPALQRAACEGAVVPVYVYDAREHGAASRWWLHRSLASLAAGLKARGATLVIKEGPPAKALLEAAKDCGAGAAAWNRVEEPGARKAEEEAAKALAAEGLSCSVFPGNVLFAPEAVKTKTGGPYRVFTPFWNRCGDLPPPAEPCGEPGPLKTPSKAVRSIPLDRLGLMPKLRWDGGLEETWEPGEPGARKALEAFVAERLRGYKASRDLPAGDETSRLSPRLHFGELDIRRVWKACGGGDPSQKGGYLGELGWRDFGVHVLHHFPSTVAEPLDARFKAFRWRKDPKGLKAWQQGMTGYPLVDAGMRQLWKTGWMHNRVRMVVASFLCKHLLVDWREGAAWFMDTLVDADLASNTLNWQWSAGCGADAAPFFRIFNPAEQARRFDPDEVYIRRWVPEYGTKDYPAPIVEHKAARQRALDAFGAGRGPR